jgi:hypothetical protein
MRIDDRDSNRQAGQEAERRDRHVALRLVTWSIRDDQLSGDDLQSCTTDEASAPRTRRADSSSRTDRSD